MHFSMKIFVLYASSDLATTEKRLRGLCVSTLCEVLMFQGNGTSLYCQCSTLYWIHGFMLHRFITVYLALAMLS